MRIFCLRKHLTHCFTSHSTPAFPPSLYSFSSSKTLPHNYTLLDTTPSPDLSLTITRIQHKKSGALIYNIKNNDPDNTFAPIVKTLPENNTGCPHILQHLACCGSQKYPIRDPFFNMLRRSVSTYMNAWTGDDFTAYPFSSSNSRDFQNLYKVYVDMCMKPVLDQLDFRQQGWRYQYNTNTTNTNTPSALQKQIKGIVFNQMKGAYQNPDRQLYTEIASRLFATTPYGYDSGGRPDSIVKLSYEQIQNMHKYYYHPSNMAFYYYGNADISQKLKYLDQEYLVKYGYKNITEQYQNKSKKLLKNLPSKLLSIFHTIQSPTAQTPNIAITYNLGQLQNITIVDSTALHILSYLLLQTNQSIFYQQFIQSNLADTFGMSGYNIGSMVTFSVTLKNVKIGEEQVYKRVQDCIRNIVSNGVDQKRLQQYVRQSQIQILTPKQTQGINYLSSCTPYMINRLPLSNLVNVRENLKQAVAKLKDKKQLEILVNKYFIKNQKKIVVKQQPIKNKQQDPYKNITGLQFSQQFIKKQQQQLKNRQNSSSSNSVQCLPKLKLSDLVSPVDKQFTVKRQGYIGQNQHKFKEIFVKIDVKDINFVRVVFKIDMKKQENQHLLKYLDIWRYAIKQGISVQGLTNKQLSSKLNLCSHDFTIDFQKPSQSQPSSINIVFSASCLTKHLPQYLQTLTKILHKPQFKQQQILNIFRSYRSQKIQELLDGAVMKYCLDYCGAQLDEGETEGEGEAQGTEGQGKGKGKRMGAGNIWNSYYWVTQGVKIAEEKCVPKEFNIIHQRLGKGADVTVVLHSYQYKEKLLDNIGFKCHEKAISQKKQKNITNKNQNTTHSATNITQIAVTNSYDVNFCSEQYKGPQFLTKDHAHITLLLQLLQQDYLHPKIREKGGAYGARAVYRDTGTIALYSYMDPYSGQTYKAFQDSVKQLLNNGKNIDENRLEEIKIKVIGGIDGPIVPQKQCLARIFKKFSIQDKRKFVQFVKNANWQSLRNTGKKYFQNTKRSRVMFGKQVPQGFVEQKLKIPKMDAEQGKASQQQQS